jgi:hypothetical protein
MKALMLVTMEAYPLRVLSFIFVMCFCHLSWSSDECRNTMFFLSFRQILDRATKQKLPPKKMKMLFNKWISFEEKHGTPEKVEHVRKQALAYVNNLTNKLDDSS